MSADPVAQWHSPTVSQAALDPANFGTRTVLFRLPDDIEREEEAQAAAKATHQREEELQKMAADPTSYLKKVEKLVAQRFIEAYEEVAKTLADLREALAATEQAGLAGATRWH